MILAVVLSAVVYSVYNGIGYLDLLLAIAGQVLAYDLVINPIRKQSLKK